jgi:hypothetical protein
VIFFDLFPPKAIMDFIERIIGISPDGGNGLFEVLLLLIAVAAGIAWSTYPSRRKA